MTTEPTPELSLYLFDGCPYCESVRRAVRDLGIEVEERNIHRDPAHHDALVAARGRSTVPVLRLTSSDEDQWMGESRDIVSYLYEHYGSGARPPVMLGPYIKIAMWGLLLGGGVAGEPLRSGLWTAACLLAGARSGWLAARTGAWVHGAVAGAFLFGAVSIALSALEVAELPWWWAAFAVAAAAIIPALRRGRGVRAASGGASGECSSL